MRVVVFHGPGKISVEEAPVPEVTPDGLLIRVHRCGICGGDVSMTSGGAGDFPVGYLMGHECSGEVVEVGRDVRGVRVGDRVGCMPMSGCGWCEMCLAGRPAFCPSVVVHQGGFSDYLSATERGVVVLPRSLSFADGALIEPMACGLRALRQAGVTGGERVLTIGAGAMALSIAYWAKQLGCGPVAVASRSAHRADVAHAMGADAVLAFDDEDPGAIDRALGGPPDIVAECVGKPGMLAKAVSHVRVGGTVISMGMCGQADAVIPAVCTNKEVRMIFPLAYSVEEYEETARAFDSGRIHPDLMVSDVIAIEDVPAVIEDLRAGRRKSLKIQVDPSLGRAK
jgi:(R,R)-butanediol dehydrogenase/meso-butanediol dehydrogenase/diacetyl reductase